MLRRLAPHNKLPLPAQWAALDRPAPGPVRIEHGERFKGAQLQRHKGRPSERRAAPRQAIAGHGAGISATDGPDSDKVDC